VNIAREFKINYVLLSLKSEGTYFILYFQIHPWIWKTTLGRSKCSHRLLSDGTSCPCIILLNLLLWHT